MVARWDDPQTCTDLLLILFKMKPLTKEEQIQAEEQMKAKGHKTTWDAIRYVSRCRTRP